MDGGTQQCTNDVTDDKENKIMRRLLRFPTRQEAGNVCDFEKVHTQRLQEETPK